MEFFTFIMWKMGVFDPSGENDFKITTHTGLAVFCDWFNYFVNKIGVLSHSYDNKVLNV